MPYIPEDATVETEPVVLPNEAKRKLTRKLLVVIGATTGLILGGAYVLFAKPETDDETDSDAPASDA